MRSQISSDASMRHAHAIRAEVDAIGVGSETVLVDDPPLRRVQSKALRPEKQQSEDDRDR